MFAISSPDEFLFSTVPMKPAVTYLTMFQVKGNPAIVLITQKNKTSEKQLL